MNSCEWMIVAGSAVQAFGFGFALFRIVITRRRELPDYVPVRHRLFRGARSRLDLLGAWVRRRLGRSPRLETKHEAEIGTAVGTGVALEANLQQAPFPTLEERVRRLEAVMTDLTDTQRADTQRLEQLITVERKRATEAEAVLRTVVGDMEGKRKDSLRTSLSLEWIGIGLFIVGLFVSTWGALCSI